MSPRKNPDQMSIHMPQKHRDRASELLALLAADGVRLVDQKGNPSVSALFRYLIDKELKARGKLSE
jgi:hypothetical protein